MCGIIGIANKTKPANKEIIFSLKALEYRGYDSAGAIFSENFQLFKTIDSISTLEKMIDHVCSCVGIGHTRWATHGKICVENAHPIVLENWAIVHNGIVENASEIKNLINYIKPKTDTDTETLLALFLYLLRKNGGDEIKALKEMKNIAKGSYAIALIQANSDKIFFVKQGLSPLICAKYLDENNNTTACAIASSTEAISQKAEIFELSNSSFGYLTCEEIKIFDNENTNSYVQDNSLGKSSSDFQNSGKSLLEMEIQEQPQLFEKARSEYAAQKSALTIADLKKYDEIVLIGCGSAYLACCVGKLWLNAVGICASAEIASEWNSRKIHHSPNTLAIFISQSGETADTLSALYIAKARNFKTLGIINKENSTIAKEADSVMYLKIGQEKSVASSKAFTAQLVKLFQLIFGNVSENLSVAAQKVIAHDFAKIAQILINFKKIIIIGKNTMYQIAQEGALKIKEITYMNVEAFAAGELKHGYIALVDEDTIAIALAPKPNKNSTDFEFEENIYNKALSNIAEIKTRGGSIMLFSQENSIDAQHFVQMPDIDINQAPIVYTIAMQLTALELAKKKMLPIDKPRNLAKAVTVE